jgi:hypothetical protein
MLALILVKASRIAANIAKLPDRV